MPLSPEHRRSLRATGWGALASSVALAVLVTSLPPIRKPEFFAAIAALGLLAAACFFRTRE